MQKVLVGRLQLLDGSRPISYYPLRSAHCYFANSTARVSRTTVTLISPG